MRASWPCAGRTQWRQLAAQACGQQRSQYTTHAHGGNEQPALRDRKAQQVATPALRERSCDTLLDDGASNLDKAAVAHARGAGRLAIRAGQATVEMQLRRRARHRAFEHLLDLVDATARTIEFVA